MARAADRPALAIHRRQPRWRAALSLDTNAARQLRQDPAWSARQPHPRRRRPLGAAGTAGRSKSAADRVLEEPLKEARLCVSLLLLELERHAVHAVALAGRLRTVGE